MHGITPTGENAAFLELTKLGEYKFNLTVGGASREFSIVVNSFPTLKLSAAYRGTTADADVAATVKEQIYRGYPFVPLGTTKVHFDLEGVNTSRVRYAVVADGQPGATNISSLTTTELADIAATFTGGILKVKHTVTTNTSTGLKTFSVFLYDADKVAIGKAVLGYYVIEQLPIVALATHNSSITGFFSNIGANQATNVNAAVAYTNNTLAGMLSNTIVVTPARGGSNVNDAVLNATSLATIVQEVIRNINVFGANKEITLDKLFINTSGAFTTGTFPTTTQVTDFAPNYDREDGYYMSLLVKDFDGNSRTIYVELKPAA
jgi:hypothetical protein